MNFKLAERCTLPLKEHTVNTVKDELSDDGAERLIRASNAIEMNNLTYFDSEEDLQKFLDETD